MAAKRLSTASVTASVFLLSLLFAFASARAPLDPAQNGVRTLHGSTDLLDSDPKTTNTLLLPSEKDSEPDTLVELEPDQIGQQGVAANPIEPEIEGEAINNSEDDAQEASKEATMEPQTASLTTVGLRPINRHYFTKHPWFLRLRGHRRGCHHRRGPMMRPWGPRELSYGNDMLVGGDKMGKRVLERQWAGRFETVGGPRFWIVRPNEVGPKGVEEGEDEMRMFRPHHHHFHRFFHHPGHHDDDEDGHRHRHHYHHDEDDSHRRHREDEREDEEREEKEHGHRHPRERRHEEEEEEEREGGIFKGIRKFLNHF